jgi:hypothetical protein
MYHSPAKSLSRGSRVVVDDPEHGFLYVWNIANSSVVLTGDKLARGPRNLNECFKPRPVTRQVPVQQMRRTKLHAGSSHESDWHL